MKRYQYKQQRQALKDIENEFSYLHTIRKQECLDMLDELVELATPKLIQYYVQPKGFAIEICPNCKMSIHGLKHTRDIHKDRSNYCDICGQALEWRN